MAKKKKNHNKKRQRIFQTKVNTRVTGALKTEAKDAAKRRHESISEFTRQSIRDEVYHDTHPGMTARELTELGRAEGTVILPGDKIKKITDTPQISEANTVWIPTMIQYLKIMKKFQPKSPLRPVLDHVLFEFKPDRLVMKFWGLDDAREDVIIINDNHFHGNQYFTADIDIILKLLSTHGKSNAATVGFIPEPGRHDEISVHFDNGQRGRIEINHPDQMPDVDALSNTVQLAELSQPDFLDLLETTEYAMATGKDTENLRGINFEFLKDKGILVAVDGFRLGAAEFPRKSTDGICYDALIDFTDVYGLITALKSNVVEGKALLEGERTITDQNAIEKVKKAFYDEFNKLTQEQKEEGLGMPSFRLSRMKFSFGNLEIITTVKDYDFPNWRRVFPRKFKIRVSANTDELYNATKILRPFYDGKDYTLPLKCSIDDGSNSMKLSVKNEGIGSGEMSIPVRIHKEKDAPKDFRIAFNPYFVMEALKSMKSQTCELNFVDKAKGFVITPVGISGRAALIMPVRP